MILPDLWEPFMAQMAVVHFSALHRYATISHLA
jgi:hypothetical protein